MPLELEEKHPEREEVRRESVAANCLLKIQLSAKTKSGCMRCDCLPGAGRLIDGLQAPN